MTLGLSALSVLRYALSVNDPNQCRAEKGLFINNLRKTGGWDLSGFDTGSVRLTVGGWR